MPGIGARLPALTFPASTNYAEATDASREDNIWVFDVRAERTFSFGERVRLRALFDFFNLSNSPARRRSAARLAWVPEPAAILAPLTARVGFRFIF